jgi:hypothetical protein
MDQFAVIGEDGWNDPSEPPDTDRTVQIAWEDMSYSENSLAFRDTIASEPQEETVYWWNLNPVSIIARPELIGAWRERP